MSKRYVQPFWIFEETVGCPSCDLTAFVKKDFSAQVWTDTLLWGHSVGSEMLLNEFSCKIIVLTITESVDQQRF